MVMRLPVLSLILLAGVLQLANSAAQAKDLAAGQGAEASLSETAERARALFKDNNYPEAALLARKVLLQKPEGRRSNELRVLLCEAKAAGKDVGDPSSVYPAAGDPQYPGLMPPSAQPPEKISGANPRLGHKARKVAGVGAVIVTAVIDEDGCVQEPAVARGANEHADQDVLKAVRNWVFRPALFEGKPIRVPYQLTVAVLN
jgi:TonB family protein